MTVLFTVLKGSGKAFSPSAIMVKNAEKILIRDNVFFSCKASRQASD